MYTTRNFKTKKELKLAVQSWNDYVANPAKYRDVMSTDVNGEALKPRRPVGVTYYQPNDMGFSPLPMSGVIYCEGPHYPKPHTWYAECVVKDGVIVKVR